MFTSVQSMGRSGDTRYDAAFIYYCLERLNQIHGQTMRYVMCKLMETGLMAHPVYSGDLERLRREYEERCGEGSEESDKSVAGVASR
jgi:hypothetical protein